MFFLTAKPAAKPVPKQTPKPPPKPTPVKPAPVVMTPIVSVVPVEDDAPPLSANGKKMLSASDEGFLMEEDIGIVHRVYQVNHIASHVFILRHFFFFLIIQTTS